MHWMVIPIFKSWIHKIGMKFLPVAIGSCI